MLFVFGCEGELGRRVEYEIDLAARSILHSQSRRLRGDSFKHIPTSVIWQTSKAFPTNGEDECEDKMRRP